MGLIFLCFQCDAPVSADCLKNAPRVVEHYSEERRARFCIFLGRKENWTSNPDFHQVIELLHYNIWLKSHFVENEWNCDGFHTSANTCLQEGSNSMCYQWARVSPASSFKQLHDFRLFCLSSVPKLASYSQASGFPCDSSCRKLRCWFILPAFKYLHWSAWKPVINLRFCWNSWREHVGNVGIT